ncbi:MAG: hypothetical protein ACJ8DC_05445 [Gemmatimonadales bacterium]
MYTVTPGRVAALLAFYAALFVVIRVIKPAIERDERRTALVIGGLWAVSVFIANYVLYRLGAMSFLPWVNDFLHTFIWIGVCLTFLYLGVRERHSMLTQFILFATFSLIVKYAERLLFGTWDQPNFLGLIPGNTAYILGWSLADGLYPPLTKYGLRLLARFLPGLVVL